MTETIDPLVAAVSTVLMVVAVAAMVILDRAYGVEKIFSLHGRGSA